MKRNGQKTELREWMDEQYRKTAGLRKRVEMRVEEMSIEQDLIALREERSDCDCADEGPARKE